MIKPKRKTYPIKPANWEMGRVVEVDARVASVEHGWPRPRVSRIPRNQFSVGDVVAFSRGRKVGSLLLAPALRERKARHVNLKTIQLWTRYQIDVRRFFASRDFFEVQTPTLVDCPGTEPFLDTFRTRFQMGRAGRSYFLPTSPELHLKKALAAGFERVFEIKTCFRNGEISPTHQPEFKMLEWYRAGQDLESIRKDLEDLIQAVCSALGVKKPGAKTGTKKFRRVTVAELFRRHVSFELHPRTSLTELRELARRLGIDARDFDWDDLFGLIFVEKIEPFIDSRSPVFVEAYPPSQAAYARIGEDGWAERFELYWKGLEIANAFHELNDPKVQKSRMREDLKKKKAAGRASVRLDAEFIAALESGMPPASGIAVGFERLFMAALDLKDLAEVRLFPMRAP